MAARDGMSTLITTLRGMTNAGTADYTLGTANFWDDDQMQLVLDRHRHDFYREDLQSVQGHLDGGSVEYKEYRSRFPNLESGTAALLIEEATGENVGTANYSVDHARGVVTFTADQAGSARYLTGRSYNLQAAAADVWSMKLAHYADTKFDFATPTHRLSRSQLVAQAERMVTFYEGKGGVETVELLA